MSAASRAALRPAPSSKPGVVSRPAPCLLPVDAAAYRAMPLEAQGREARTSSTDGDPLLGFPGPVRRVSEHERPEAVFAVRVGLASGIHRADEGVELVAIGDLIAL